MTKTSYGKISAACILLILSLAILSVHMPASTAVTIEADYDLSSGEATVRYGVMLDENETLRNYFVPLPADTKDLEISAEHEIVISSNMKYALFAELGNDTDMTFRSKSFIDEGKDNYFLADFSEFTYDHLNSEVFLPEDARLKYRAADSQSSYIPSTADVKTDGQRIIVEWNEDDFTSNSAAMIIYRTQKRDNTVYMMLIALIVSLTALAFFIRTKSSRSGSKQDITANLYEDEKKIVDNIMEADGQELWQKELQLRTGISKVKLSRKLRNLQARGIIDKVPYGNTNKIRIRRKTDE